MKEDCRTPDVARRSAQTVHLSGQVGPELVVVVLCDGERCFFERRPDVGLGSRGEEAGLPWEPEEHVGDAVRIGLGG